MAKNDDEFSEMHQDKELLEAFNQTCDNDGFEISSITIGGGSLVNMSDGTHRYHIGTETIEEGKPKSYDIDDDALWEQILRIVYLRARKGSRSLISLYTICRIITDECTVTNMTIIGKHVVPMFKERFGVSDAGEDREYNGYKGLRGTIKWWGTIGGNSNPGRRTKRMYEITNARKLIKYIEGEIDVEKYRNENGNKSSSDGKT